MTTPDLAAIVRKLTPGQRDALVPLSFFSDAVGAELVALGLMSRPDGAWAHTQLGWDAHLLSETNDV